MLEVVGVVDRKGAMRRVRVLVAVCSGVSLIAARSSSATTTCEASVLAVTSPTSYSQATTSACGEVILALDHRTGLTPPFGPYRPEHQVDAFGSAAASRGALGINASGFTNNWDLGGASVVAHAEFITEVIFRDLADPFPSPFRTALASMNYHLSGFILADRFPNSYGSVLVEAEITFGGGLPESGSFLEEFLGGGGYTLTTQGIFSPSTGDVVDRNGSTAVQEVPFNTPVKVQMIMDLQLLAAATLAQELYEITPVFIAGLFGNTMSFPTSGNVFNVPEGITVESPDGIIVDNVWVETFPQIPVPEPSTMLLLGMGLTALAFPRTHRRDSRLRRPRPTGYRELV